jgi:hypothetical protein
MRFERALLAFGTDAFGATLRKELDEHVKELPLEKACENGGYPDDRDTNIAIGEIEADVKEIRARVTITFTENYKSGCGDNIVPYPRVMDCHLAIDRSTGQVGVKVVEPDYIEEF